MLTLVGGIQEQNLNTVTQKQKKKISGKDEKLATNFTNFL